jgi:hypothetical protein
VKESVETVSLVAAVTVKSDITCNVGRTVRTSVTVDA